MFSSASPTIAILKIPGQMKLPKQIWCAIQENMTLPIKRRQYQQSLNWNKLVWYHFHIRVIKCIFSYITIPIPLHRQHAGGPTNTSDFFAGLIMNGVILFVKYLVSGDLLNLQPLFPLRQDMEAKLQSPGHMIDSWHPNLIWSYPGPQTHDHLINIKMTCITLLIPMISGIIFQE